ncbi:MAG: hypothetical protein QNJ27_02925 [Simkaniaceae bacterium]|nr:hypothetical protein [Simkaniaceae bacterium]
MDPVYDAPLSTRYVSPRLNKVLVFDDSCNKRVAIPEAFLASDSFVNLLYTIIERIKIDPKMMETHSENPLSFSATATLNEKDRQETSELFRKLLDLLSLKEKDLRNFLEIKNGGLGDSYDRLLLY